MRLSPSAALSPRALACISYTAAALLEAGTIRGRAALVVESRLAALPDAERARRLDELAERRPGQARSEPESRREPA